MMQNIGATRCPMLASLRKVCTCMKALRLRVGCSHPPCSTHRACGLSQQATCRSTSPSHTSFTGLKRQPTIRAKTTDLKGTRHAMGLSVVQHHQAHKPSSSRNHNASLPDQWYPHGVLAGPLPCSPSGPCSEPLQATGASLFHGCTSPHMNVFQPVTGWPLQTTRFWIPMRAHIEHAKC